MPLPAETVFFKFKGRCPFKKKKKHQWLNGDQRAIDWYHFWPTLVFSDYTFSVTVFYLISEFYPKKPNVGCLISPIYFPQLLVSTYLCILGSLFSLRFAARTTEAEVATSNKNMRKLEYFTTRACHLSTAATLVIPASTVCANKSKSNRIPFVLYLFIRV